MIKFPRSAIELVEFDGMAINIAKISDSYSDNVSTCSGEVVFYFPNLLATRTIRHLGDEKSFVPVERWGGSFKG